jgi:DNA-binding response OmpR family regulator
MDRPPHILLIDDDPEVGSTTQWLLEENGFIVSVVTNGEEGLHLQRAEPADVVVTDMYMPDKDGIETIAEFREEFPHVPIVAISGGGVAGHRDPLFVARELGVHEVLRKPFDPEKLVAVIREVVRSTAGRADGEAH